MDNSGGFLFAENATKNDPKIVINVCEGKIFGGVDVHKQELLSRFL